MGRSPRITLTPVRIVLVYAVVGASWVLLSDRVLDSLALDPAVAEKWQSVKGAVFILVTSALLLLLILRFRRERQFLSNAVRTVLDGMADAVLVVDAERRIEDANMAAARLFSASSREELLGSLENLVERTQLALPEPLLSQPAATHECSMRRLDGREIVVQVTTSTVHRPDGKSRGFVVVLRDQSETSHFEEAREEFIATAAHEFRTPLAVVKAYAQLMRKRSQGDAAALDVIARQVDRLTRILQQLLEISRFRLSSSELKREPFDLGELLSEVCAALRDRTEGRRILVSPVRAPVQGDKSRIGQVLLRLLENALRFEPNGGQVEATLVVEGDRAIVSVRDHGPGIPPDRQPYVFEPSFATFPAKLPSSGVFGIGLDMSREIVARHGGQLWFESAAGRGSTFAFSLPFSPEATA
ncbi:MAG TPA: ATP-binding protein [Anaeromyxobacteraceae bacterium]|nr:ATP-binding protein [Anaeromyxobacteraceae bacterium]